MEGSDKIGSQFMEGARNQRLALSSTDKGAESSGVQAGESDSGSDPSRSGCPALSQRRAPLLAGDFGQMA